MSGGQTGVDQAALRAAQVSGLLLGGWCPPGRKRESGIIPSTFPLRETENDRSADAPNIQHSQRTELNVRDSDATLILKPASQCEKDPGTLWTARCAARYERPLLICDPKDSIAPNLVQQWLGPLPIETLNVAGPSEGTCPGIEAQSYDLLVEIFKRYR